jgi:hypothetical protein
MRTLNLSTVLFLLLAGSAAAEEVWFAPPDNMDRGARSYNKDFRQLFDPSPAWSARADVFVLSPLFAETATEEQAKRVSGFLADHHIALAVGIGAVQMDNAQQTDGECTRILRRSHRIPCSALESKSRRSASAAAI